MKQSFLRLFLGIAVATAAHAHFVFIVPQGNNATAKVFISESLAPDGDVDINLVSGSKLSLRNSRGQESTLPLTKAGDAYTVPLSGTGTRVVHGLADLGISGEADKSYLLLYYPKTILGDAFDTKSVVGSATPVEIVPQGRVGAVTLKLLAHGKPLPDAEITVVMPDGKDKTVKTNKDGVSEVLTQTGRYGAWARFWEPGTGQRDGKSYADVHNYATLVFDAGTAGAGQTSASVFGKLPQATASFGSVVSDGWLYVYGGHVSPTHTYFLEAVSGRFDRMRLRGEPVWESLPSGPAMQGMNLVEYKGKIYRIGGMTPRNKKGDPSDNYSVAENARFDPATKQWESIPSLPEPRSSHDVVVIGDQLFVAGGWNLTGKTEKWMDTMLVMDLSAKKPEWTSIPQPFKRRALMAATLDGKLYVIGGINENEDVEGTVSIYDPKTKSWGNAPLLPQGPVLGFSPAAGVHQGSIYVSIANGSLLKLNKADAAWDTVGTATPRVAHRLASRGNSILVMGGADSGDNSDLIEAVEIGR